MLYIPEQEKRHEIRLLQLNRDSEWGKLVGHIPVKQTSEERGVKIPRILLQFGRRQAFKFQFPIEFVQIWTNVFTSQDVHFRNVHAEFFSLTLYIVSMLP